MIVVNTGFKEEYIMKRAIAAIIFVAFVSLLSAGGDLIQAGNYDNAKKHCDDDRIYVDHRAKLMWQDEPYGDIEDGAYKHNRSAGKAGRWRYAKSYCSSLVYAGFDDWRLPKIDELVKVYDDKIYFKNRIDVDFWSSTPSKGNTYWSLYAVVTGQPYAHKSSDSQYIRCVRCLDE